MTSPVGNILTIGLLLLAAAAWRFQAKFRIPDFRTHKGRALVAMYVAVVFLVQPMLNPANRIQLAVGGAAATYISSFLSNGEDIRPMRRHQEVLAKRLTILVPFGLVLAAGTIAYLITRNMLGN